MPFVNLSGKQDADATLAALAAWDWSSGTEVAAFTADDTLSIMRVGTGANNLVQLNGSGALPAVSGENLTDLPSSDIPSDDGPNYPIYSQDSEVWLGPQGLNATNINPSANTIYAVRVFVEQTMTFEAMRCITATTPFSAGSLIRMAIATSGANRRPGTIVIDGGTIAADGSVGNRDYTFSQQLNRGYYWILWSTNGTGGQLACGALTGSTLGIAAVTAGNTGNIQYLTRAATFGAYADQTGATWTKVHAANPCPRFLIRPDLDTLP